MIDRKTVSHFPGLEKMDADSLAYFVSMAQLADVPTGSTVFAAGQSCENYLLVIRGCVRVQINSENGREIVLYRVENGQTCIFTTSCLMTGDSYAAEGITESDVSAVMIPAAAFHRLVGISEAFRSFVFASYGQRISDLLVLVDQVAFHRIDLRLARFVKEYGGEDRKLAMTHQRLAMELGSAREVISRQLKEFERRGWLKLHRGSIEIIDEPALNAFIENAKTPL